MNTVMGVVGIPQTRKCVMIELQSLRSFNLVLRKDKEWFVGIDQSSSCTGISLIAADYSYIILLDLKRDRNLLREVFYDEMYNFIKRLAKGNKFLVIANERPVPSKYRNAGVLLMELKGKIDEWIRTIPEFEGVEHASLFPQTWKSLVVDKSKGKGRTRDKYAIATDITDAFPVLRPYLQQYPYSDYDSFDATGIIWGYLQYAFDERGNRLICGDKEKRHVSFVCYQWVPASTLSSASIAATFGRFRVLFPLKFLGYNQRYSLFENIRMSSTNNDAVVTIVPPSELQALQWKFGVDVSEPDHVMLMYVFRKGSYTTPQLNVLKSIFSWNEEVVDESR